MNDSSLGATNFAYILRRNPYIYRKKIINIIVIWSPLLSDRIITPKKTTSSYHINYVNFMCPILPPIPILPDLTLYITDWYSYLRCRTRVTYPMACTYNIVQLHSCTYVHSPGQVNYRAERSMWGGHVKGGIR